MAGESFIIMNDYEITQPSNGWVGRVHNINDLNLKMNRGRQQFWAGGLYDPGIFGNPNKCLCYQNFNVKGKTCPNCRVKVVDYDTYLKSYATYKLEVPYVPFISYGALRNEILKIMPLPTYVDSSGEVRTFKGTSNEDFWSMYLKVSTEAYDGSTLLFDAEGNAKYVKLVDLPSPEEFTENDSWQFAGLFGLSLLGDLYDANGVKLEKIKNLIHYQLIISSPGRRPYNFVNGLLSIPTETINYRAIITYSKIVFKLINEYPIVDAMTLCALLNTMINRHFADNELLQPSKQSLGRTLIDTRVSKSLRAGIVSKLYDDNGDPVPMDTIYVPRPLFYQAIQYDIINRLTDQLVSENLELGKEVGFEDAKQLFKQQDYRAVKICEDILEESMCILTRNPSLSKFSQFAFKMRLHDEPFIGLPTAVDEAYNADHDGDTVAIWIYTDPSHVAKLQLMTAEHLWVYDKSYRSPFNFNNEMLYGLYMATVVKAVDEVKCFQSFEDAENAYNNDEIKVNQLIKIDNNETTYGRTKLSNLCGFNINELIEQSRASFDKSSPEALKSDTRYLDAHGINKSNIGNFILALGNNPHRVAIYGEVQKFASQVATIVGLGPVPYQELYNASDKEIEAIIDDNNYDSSLSEVEVAMLKKEKLASMFNKELERSINNLPNTNINELQMSAGKVKIDKLVQVYCPSINGETNAELTAFDSDSLFDGLSEQSYMSMAVQNRETLKIKQDSTPVGGFLQRQLNDLEWNTIYKANEYSPDTKGVYIDGEFAEGRVDIATGKEFTTKQPGIVKVKSCVTSGIKDVVFGDEIAKFRYTATDGSSIGASFSSAVTEQVMQDALGFKHGGSINGIDVHKIVSLEEGVITSITQKFIVIKGSHEYKYRLTDCCVLHADIKEGINVIEGTVLACKYERTTPDSPLSKISTLFDSHVAGDLGAKRAKRLSYSVSSGIIKYSDSFITIGDINYQIEEDELYMYPEGYEIRFGEAICTGVPNIQRLAQLTDDIGILYYIFYSYFSTIISGFNTEPIEVLFKNIMNDGFSVKKALANKESLVDRLYFGASVRNISSAITTAVSEAIVPENKEVKEKISVDDAVRIELNKRKTSINEPTNRVLKKVKNAVQNEDEKAFVEVLEIITNDNSDESDGIAGYADWDEVKAHLINRNPKFEAMSKSEIRNQITDWIENSIDASVLAPYVSMNRSGVSVRIVKSQREKDPNDKVSQRTPHISLGNSIVTGIILKSLNQ